MKTPKNIDVLFVVGFGPIVRDPAASRKFYSEALGLEFIEDANGYLYTGALGGVKHLPCGRWRRRLDPALARINGLAILPCRKRGSSLM
jgi:catechol 2,3-dioxygenase-like lactoylglutathione lyase family enzyme